MRAASRRRSVPARRRRRMSAPTEAGRWSTVTTAPSCGSRTCTSASAPSRCSRASTSTSSAARSICILGPSGSGKSTLLRCVNLLEPPEAGRISARGQGDHRPGQPRGLDFVRRRVGMVFQQFNLFPHKTALENVTLAQRDGARPLEQEAAERGRRAARARRPRGQASTSTRSASPAGSSSGWRSPGRWRWIPR